MPPSRFGASKYRNAQASIPGRDEWYRGNLPATSSGTTSSFASTFSSEIKVNREWIVTLSPAGELSYRGYDAIGTGDGARVLRGLGGGGGVGDWDLSRLEGGLVAVGGLDGSIAIHTLPSPQTPPVAPTHVRTIPHTGSAITNLCLHPTTPNLLLASSISHPIAVYDPFSSPTAPVLQMTAQEPKGMWCTAWSPDGKLIAGVGKSGTCYVWDPRAGADPIMSKPLNLQPLKPVRVAWVGENIFVTSFSKTRNREFSLLSTSSALSTTFSQVVDTNTAPLIPLVDQERRIVYAAGRGDMNVRQIELCGPMGFLETFHSLPHPLASASLAVASATTLPVMRAQIGTVLLPVMDKDGETILPLEIKVPRRHFIDFHGDLYPDIMGTVPEQTAAEWLKGEDRLPLPISLDPSRRGAWEADLFKRSASTSKPRDLAAEAGTSASSAPSIPPPSAPAPVVPQSEKPHVSPIASSTKPFSASAISYKAALPVQTASAAPRHASTQTEMSSESTSSTSYKARLITDHIMAQLEKHQKTGNSGPLMMGLQGPQGCGKTTLCNALLSFLSEAPNNLKVAVLSLDDLYRTNTGLKELAQKHPNNHLLSGRGPPGTHDVKLAASVLKEIGEINSSSEKVVQLPIFDKSLCGGEGDRSSETVAVKGPLDVFILEGWSMGFSPLSDDDLTSGYASGKNAEKQPYFTSHSLASLSELNDYLSEFAAAVYPLFETMVAIQPTDYEDVFRWRLEQEQAMKAKNGGKGMADEQVRTFVERYMPVYELWREGMWDEKKPWAGKSLELFFGNDREVIRASKPEVSRQETDGNAKVAVPISASQPSVLATASPAATTITASSLTQQILSQAEPPTTCPAASTPVPATKPSQTPAAAPSYPPFNPSWSRKFLVAKAPLIPSYDSLPPLSTLHPDSLVLKATPHLAFFPIQGTGGRLVVHPLSKKGRMKVGGEGYLSTGMDIVDFAVELFDDGRVTVAGEDGQVKVWTVPKEGVQGVGPEAEQVLRGNGIDRIVQVEFHPTARNLLVVGSNDHGSSSIRFFDLSLGKEVKVVQLDAKGIFNFRWSPSADRIAVATKEGSILVLDPRDPATSLSGKAHDSPRSFHIEWIDDSHLVSVGFSKGSQRKVNLYSLDSEVRNLTSLTVDVSPSVLFAKYDPDTCVLYIWGKGERVIHAYEVHPGTNESLAKLPSYTAGEAQLSVFWLPKRMVDVRKVEVGKVLRLTAKTMEEVSFSIPRNRPEFFQDDIYPETIDVETPVTTASEWLGGAIRAPRRINLQPGGMIPLSQAPKTTSMAKAKFVPAKDVMSEAEKKRREMDALFAKAKADESSDDEPQRSGLDPPDDDW